MARKTDYTKTKERIEDNSTPLTESGCWIWTGAIGMNGYPRLYMGRNTYIDAHRESYRVFKGELVSGMCVCHKCDITICVNPEHLFLGTRKENAQDSLRKGRHNSFSDRPNKSVMVFSRNKHKRNI